MKISLHHPLPTTPSVQVTLSPEEVQEILKVYVDDRSTLVGENAASFTITALVRELKAKRSAGWR